MGNFWVGNELYVLVKKILRPGQAILKNIRPVIIAAQKNVS